jgi:hypothetical protein
MTKLPICPRCKHYLPDDAEPGAGPGVPSMSVSSGSPQLWICMPCGWHEAWQRAHNELVDMTAWPLEVPERFYRGVGSC